jgi:hypothetical protein
MILRSFTRKALDQLLMHNRERKHGEFRDDLSSVPGFRRFEGG